jgi:hypothetical protein
LSLYSLVPLSSQSLIAINAYACFDIPAAEKRASSGNGFESDTLDII